MFTDFPVKDRRSWDEYKERLNPNDPRRYPKDWEKDAYIDVFENFQRQPTVLSFSGFYAFGAQLMGIVNFNLAFHKDPELIHSMAEYWEYFTIETIRDAVETLRARIDIVYWLEDMADKHGPNISPKFCNDFLLPHYKKVTAFLNRNMIDRIMIDSDGNMNPCLDFLVEAGFTGMWPLEVNSGMDARVIRKKYGNRLFLAGNLDKRELAKGGEAMRREIESKLPVLKETSGYIPGADHLIGIEFTYDKFKEYAAYVKTQLEY
jgi:uroporphyrinogen decarboxylase